MANFFDDLGAALNKVAGDVKNEVTVAAREQKLKEAFQKLGKLHFEAVSGDRNPDDQEFQQLIDEIRRLKKEIAELKEK